MKQEEDMKRLGYIGSIQKKEDTDDDEFHKTYASELTLSEKHGKTTRKISTSTLDSKASLSTSESKKGKQTTSLTTTIWIVSLIIVVVSFTASKTGSENIRRVITGKMFLHEDIFIYITN